MDANEFASTLDSLIESHGTGAVQLKVNTDTDTLRVLDIVWDEANNCFMILAELDEDDDDDDDDDEEDDDDE